MTRDQHGVNKNLADETYNNPGNIGKRNRRTKAASGLETISSCIRHCKLSWKNSPQKDRHPGSPKPNKEYSEKDDPRNEGWLAWTSWVDIFSFSVFVIIYQVTFLSPAARTSSSNWPKAPSALPLSSKIAPTAPFPKTAEIRPRQMPDLIYIYYDIYMTYLHIKSSSTINDSVPKLERITKRCHISTELCKWHTIFQTTIC